MRGDLAADVDRGTLTDLARAQLRGRRLVVSNPQDRDAAGLLAFADAALAVDYGLPTAAEAARVIGAGERAPAPPAAADTLSATGGPAEAALALLALRAGQVPAGVTRAVAAATRWPESPHPLYALGRARALRGDLPNAVRALDAAAVRAPGFLAARVAAAEARLDLGDAKGARDALAPVLARAPDDLRARLLQDQIEVALGENENVTLAAACPAPRGTWPPDYVRASCALARAASARRDGRRAEALRFVTMAAELAPDEPRLLGRTALLLAQLGAVDRAAGLVSRAERLAAPTVPALAWAVSAIGLGRGRVTGLPRGPRPGDPEVRLLAARAALAAGGPAELRAVLAGLGAPAVAGDADLQSFANLAHAAATTGAGGSAGGAGGESFEDTHATEDDPVHAYVEGLAAQLRGDQLGAAEQFFHALADHGDACRAAGEYVATVRALKAPADPAAWSALEAENTGCVNTRVHETAGAKR